MSNRRGAFLPGLSLILLGVWLLARNLDVPVPGLGELWPAFLIILGLGLLLQYFAAGRRDHGLLFMGASSALLGAFFLSITLGPLEWRDLGRYWPVFPLIGGVSFLVQWLAQPADRGLLVPALGGLAVGGLALVFTLDRVDPALARQAARLWPAGLVLLGLALLASYFFAPRRG